MFTGTPKSTPPPPPPPPGTKPPGTPGSKLPPGTPGTKIRFKMPPGSQATGGQSGSGIGGNSGQGLDLGTISFSSPIQRRYRQTRRSLLSAADIHAINLNNDVAGPEGQQFPIPNTPFSSQVQPPVVPVPKSKVQAPLPVRTVTIDGRPLTLKTTPTDRNVFVPGRTWDKTLRSQLKPEEKIAFLKSATGYVLSKTNKLSVLTTKVDDDGVLTHVHNLAAQVKALRNHIIDHDLVDVFTIVVPEDISLTGNLSVDPDTKQLQAYDLFTDYMRLHPAVVATSNAWYNAWAGQSYIQENLHHTFTLLERNTDEKLWSKCLEEYEEFHVMQRGGPLMFLLIMRRIQNNSESAITHMIEKVTKLKISKLTGENVDTAVSLIKSTYQVLVSVTTQARSYVPDDFEHTILKVLQTTSVNAFNEIFRDEEKLALREADKYGGLPKFPSITESLNLATKSYQRLLLEDKWTKSKPSPSPALNVTPARGNHQSGRPRHGGIKCWNGCGQNHPYSECSQPLDEARIERNKKAFFDAKKARQSSNSRTSKPLPRTKMSRDGKPLVLNDKGLYVIDTKAMQRETEKKLASTTAALNTMIDKALDGTLPSPVAPPAPTTSSPSPTTPATAAVTPSSYRDQVRQAFLAMLQPAHD